MNTEIRFDIDKVNSYFKPLDFVRILFAMYSKDNDEPLEVKSIDLQLNELELHYNDNFKYLLIQISEKMQNKLKDLNILIFVIDPKKSYVYYLDKKIIAERIKYGEEGDSWNDGISNCGDCNCRIGEYHQEFCDVEREPLDSYLQLLSSDDAYVII